MNETLLSVVVPVYNVAPWLPRCLDSILAQTYQNLEILVIDDGSTDDSPQIVDDYAREHERVKAIHQNNQGLIATRERGIREAKGNYIGFVDGDDEIIPEMYERLVNNALKYGAQISQCGIMCIYNDGREEPLYGTNKLSIFNRQEGCRALLKGTQIEPSLCNKIYCASLLKDSCLDSSVINNEDMLRNIVLFNRAERSVLEDFCGYIYWRRSGSMSSHTNSVDIVQNILKARKTIFDYVPEELKKDARINYTQGAARCYNILLNDKSDEAIKLRKECRRILRRFWAINKEEPVKDQLRVNMILYLPFLYDLVERIHLKRKQRQ